MERMRLLNAFVLSIAVFASVSFGMRLADNSRRLDDLEHSIGSLESRMEEELIRAKRAYDEARYRVGDRVSVNNGAWCGREAIVAGIHSDGRAWCRVGDEMELVRTVDLSLSDLRDPMQMN